MSVTFAVDAPVSEWTVECSCGSARSAVFTSYESASTSRDLDAPVVCGDDYCAAYSCCVVAVEETESVNVSNLNARFVLESMGVLSEDLMGSMSGDEFLGYVLMCQGAGVSDAGVPSTADGIMVNCGRPEGYLDEVLVRLEAVASTARNSGFPVYWS